MHIHTSSLHNGVGVSEIQLQRIHHIFRIMKALIVTKAGSASDNLELVQDTPKPSPEKNELLIKVEAAGTFTLYLPNMNLQSTESCGLEGS